jgi:P-aminobenzoate N-oxygenase AurF
MAFIGGYASVFHMIAVLCGEQPLHHQQTMQHRGAFQVPPLLNKITHIHLAEEARHIAFADDHLAQQMRGSSSAPSATSGRTRCRSTPS